MNLLDTAVVAADALQEGFSETRSLLTMANTMNQSSIPNTLRRNMRVCTLIMTIMIEQITETHTTPLIDGPRLWERNSGEGTVVSPESDMLSGRRRRCCKRRYCYCRQRRDELVRPRRPFLLEPS